MLLYGLYPEANDLDALLASTVTWLCLLAAAVVLVSDTETVLMVSSSVGVLLILVFIV